MSLFAIYASASAEKPLCNTLTDDPDCGPVEALEMARGNEWVAWQLTASAYAERVEEFLK